VGIFKIRSGILPALALTCASTTALADVKRYRSGGWDINIHHDNFTGVTRCALVSSDQRMRFQPGAIGFQTSKHRNTLATWYRVDDGQPVRWQDRTATLIESGAAIDGPGLDNPTGGWVWVPLTEVQDANRIAIRTSDRARVRTFSLGEFAPMLEAARRLGCASDNAFRI